MNAEQLLTDIAQALKRFPVPGISAAEIDAFLVRHRAGLLRVIRQQYRQLCRPDRLIESYELEVGNGWFPPQPQAQVAVFPRDVGTNPEVHFAVKARCLPLDPLEARQYAVHSRRKDERTWRIHPGEDWHAKEDAALEAFVAAHLDELKWFVPDEDGGLSGELEGALEGPILLTNAGAVELAQYQLQKRELGQAQAERQARKRQGAGKLPANRKTRPTEGRQAAKANGRKRGLERMDESVSKSSGDADDSAPDLHRIIPDLVTRGGLKPRLVSLLTPSERAKAMAIPGFFATDGMTLLQAARAHFGPLKKVVPRRVSAEERAQGLESVENFLEDLDWALDAWNQEGVERLCGCART